MRIASTIVYASVAALLLACNDSTGPSDHTGKTTRLPDGAFQVSPATVTLQYGQTFRLTTTYSGNPALSTTPGDVTWSSSDANVASVSNGLVRGVSGGEARIVATWGGYQATALVTVTGPWKKHENPPVCLMRLPLTQC